MKKGIKIYKNQLKGFAFILAIVAVAVLSFSATYAYMISKAEKPNEFKPGNNEVIVDEPPVKSPPKLVPGSVIIKQPSIKNIGNENVYARARVLFSDSDAKAQCEELNINSNWVLEDDGWYYFKNVIAPGTNSDTLFDEIKIKEDAVQDDIKNFDLIIYTESVNADGYNNYTDAFNAKGGN